MDPVPTIPISSALMPHHNGRVVKQLDRFMYLGKPFEAILKDHDINPIDYNDTMSDVYTHFLVKGYGEVELESL